MENEFIFLRVSGIEDSQGALTNLGKKLYEKGKVKESFIPAILEREITFPTGLPFEGYGVAIPHTDAEHVLQTQIAVMTLDKPVTFTQMATKDQEVEVGLIVMLAIKEAHSQLEMLQKLIGLLQNEALVQEIMSCPKGQESHVLTLLSTNNII